MTILFTLELYIQIQNDAECFICHMQVNKQSMQRNVMDKKNQSTHFQKHYKNDQYKTYI